MYNGPEVPMSILFLSVAAVFILRFAERLLARQDDRAALPQRRE